MFPVHTKLKQRGCDRPTLRAIRTVLLASVIAAVFLSLNAKAQPVPAHQSATVKAMRAEVTARRAELKQLRARNKAEKDAKAEERLAAQIKKLDEQLAKARQGGAK